MIETNKRAKKGSLSRKNETIINKLLGPRRRTQQQPMDELVLVVDVIGEELAVYFCPDLLMEVS